MPGGGGVKIPRECVDARGVKRALFNPALRRGDVVVGQPGLHFPPGDMRRVLDTLHPRSRRSSRSLFRQYGAWLLWPCMVAPIAYLGRNDPTMPVVFCGALALPLVAAGFYVTLQWTASRTWGVVAFTGAAEPVVRAMLGVGRCPSCAYPLAGQPAHDGCTVCTECGAAWRLPV